MLMVASYCMCGFLHGLGMPSPYTSIDQPIVSSLR